MTNSSLRRYWIEFPEGFDVYSVGYGVTAVDLADAIQLIERFRRSSLGAGSMLPQPTRVVEDVDVSTLDAGHVRPNAGPPNWRGVWFPLTTLGVPRD